LRLLRKDPLDKHPEMLLADPVLAVVEEAGVEAEEAEGEVSLVLREEPSKRVVKLSTTKRPLPPMSAGSAPQRPKQPKEPRLKPDTTRQLKVRKAVLPDVVVVAVLEGAEEVTTEEAITPKLTTSRREKTSPRATTNHAATTKVATRATTKAATTARAATATITKARTTARATTTTNEATSMPRKASKAATTASSKAVKALPQDAAFAADSAAVVAGEADPEAHLAEPDAEDAVAVKALQAHSPPATSDRLITSSLASDRKIEATAR